MSSIARKIVRSISLLITLLAVHGSGQAQIITTIAGNYGIDSIYDGGPATAASLFMPRFVAVDSLHNVYISDYEHNRLRKVNPAGIISTIAGQGLPGGYNGDNGPATAADTRLPTGIAVDAAGNIYFADEGNNCIRRIGASGMITTVAGNGTYGYSGDNGPATLAQLSMPSGIALDRYGNIFIADNGNNCIRKVSTAGVITTICGTNVPGFSGDGDPATNATIKEPVGIAVDPIGNIFFADFGNTRIRKINASGVISTIAGTDSIGFNGDGIPATSAWLNMPAGLALDKNGNIYIADMGNQRIRKINTSGIITTVAGFGIGDFAGDGGPPLYAFLDGPWGVAVDARGNIYIADEGNNRIRLVSYTVSVPVAIAQEPKINIFPNPSAGSFDMSISTLSVPAPITITNVQGTVVKEMQCSPNRMQHITLDVPAGMYFVTAKVNGCELTKKIMVIR